MLIRVLQWLLGIERIIEEASKQLENKDAYEGVQNNPSTLINTLSTIMCVLENIRIRCDLLNDTLNYFQVKDPKSTRFYLLPKI